MAPSLFTREARGRLAPTPTGYLHAGHAATFWTAQQRARAAGGRLFLRIEDLDPHRCKPEFADAAIEDLRWFGFRWDGEPVYQSQRRPLHLDAWRRLRESGLIYPCARSRKDVAAASQAPHDGEDTDPIYPAEWRPLPSAANAWHSPTGINWRFRVPDGETIGFDDSRLGRIEKVAGRDFGDFIIWNRDDIPAYELAVVADDIAMRITEVVRGEDLLTSTCRQILVYRALGAKPPAFYHCPLVLDATGRRLAKRASAQSLRELRAAGKSPSEILTSQAPSPRPAQS